MSFKQAYRYITDLKATIDIALDNMQAIMQLPSDAEKQYYLSQMQTPQTPIQQHSQQLMLACVNHYNMLYAALSDSIQDSYHYLEKLEQVTGNISHQIKHTQLKKNTFYSSELLTDDIDTSQNRIIMYHTTKAIHKKINPFHAIITAIRNTINEHNQQVFTHICKNLMPYLKSDIEDEIKLFTDIIAMYNAYAKAHPDAIDPPVDDQTAFKTDVTTNILNPYYQTHPFAFHIEIADMLDLMARREYETVAFSERYKTPRHHELMVLWYIEEHAMDEPYQYDIQSLENMYEWIRHFIDKTHQDVDAYNPRRKYVTHRLIERLDAYFK